MARIFVAGFGNPLRADDGAGWYAASLLQEWWLTLPEPDRGEVRVTAAQQPLPEWAPLLAEAETAFFIDAIPTTGRAASESLASETALSLEPIGPRTRSETPGSRALLDGHALGLEGLLVMAEALFGRAPEAYLIAVPAHRFAFSEELSARTTAAVQAAVALVQGAVLAALSAPRSSAPTTAGASPLRQPSAA